MKRTYRAAVYALLVLPCLGFDSEDSQHKGDDNPMKVHVYDIPRNLFDRDKRCDMFGCQLTKRLLASKYYTSNPEEAHYFWIPGHGMYKHQSILMEVLNYVRMSYPYWNRSVAAGQTRHFMALTGDHGPGDAAFTRETNLDRPDLPLDLNPASPTRVVGFVVWNGVRDGADSNQRGCMMCFQAGKDIMMPTAHNVCGPLCGYSRERLRNSSIWRPEADVEAELTRPRDRLLFYGGSSYGQGDEYTGRSQIFKLYGDHPDYHLVNRRARNRTAKVPFNVAMKNADFCYSPLGQFGGDPDRYVPSILFGCIPVMLASNRRTGTKVPHALPLEEALPWHEFGTIIDAGSIADLDAQMRCLRPHVLAMRKAMARVWRHMLYSSIYGTYFGEDINTDAFEAIMAVLKNRMRHNYTMPPRVRHRVLEARDSYFMCRKPSGDGP